MPRVPTPKRDAILEALTKIVENGQIMGATYQQLATKYEVSRQAISKYLKIVYANIPEEDIQNIRVKIQVMFDRIFREVNKLMATAKTTKEKNSAIRLMLDCMDKFQEFLESFGIKQKVADKLEIEANISITPEEVTKRAEDIILDIEAEDNG